MTERTETHLLNPVPGSIAELELRIELLEDDIDYLCRVVRMASIRERELRNRLGLADEAVAREHVELSGVIDLLASGPRTRN